MNDFMLQINNLVNVLQQHVPPILEICVSINMCKAQV